MPYSFKICDDLLFEKVKQYILAFELDNRQLKKEEFLTLNKGENMLAFGRIRDYAGFSELCSLGVLASERHKGLGKKIVKALADNCKQPVYLVSVIPTFFEEIGFRICENYPAEIAEKLNYCIKSLSVPERYVVMSRI